MRFSYSSFTDKTGLEVRSDGAGPLISVDLYHSVCGGNLRHHLTGSVLIRQKNRPRVKPCHHVHEQTISLR